VGGVLDILPLAAETAGGSFLVSPKIGLMIWTLLGVRHHALSC
jgi:hypothetical protein